VFVHGRAQENKDSIALKAEWLAALNKGLAKSGLKLPIAESEVRFPYYGDTLYDLADGKSAQDAAAVVLRGADTDEDEKRFARAVAAQVLEKAGLSDAEVAEIASKEVVERGILNWGWFQAILETLDRRVPFASGSSIALFTHDVYQYLKNSGIRETIHDGVRAAFTPEVETVVVSHSLGTVVAYNLLRQQGHLLNWKVPMFITLGSPLAVAEIRKAIRALAPTRCPNCVSAWFNAMDERDVVALFPLDTSHFPLDPAMPAIENKRDIDNQTQNRHGISGYLDDEQVAKRIYVALTA
jgi:hypothetical protein